MRIRLPQSEEIEFQGLALQGLESLILSGFAHIYCVRNQSKVGSVEKLHEKGIGLVPVVVMRHTQRALPGRKVGL